MISIIGRFGLRVLRCFSRVRLLMLGRWMLLMMMLVKLWLICCSVFLVLLMLM